MNRLTRFLTVTGLEEMGVSVGDLSSEYVNCQLSEKDHLGRQDSSANNNTSLVSTNKIFLSIIMQSYSIWI